MSSKLKFIRAESPEHAAIISRLAHSIFHKVYTRFMTGQEIQYMLEYRFQEAQIIEQFNRMDHYILFCDEVAAGFITFSYLSSVELRLERLYLEPDMHGKGLGKAMFTFMTGYTYARQVKEISLIVNRKNQAVGFYKRHGFKVDQEITTNLGQLVLSDYIMKAVVGDLVV